jgi:hypothetical protein
MQAVQPGRGVPGGPEVIILIFLLFLLPFALASAAVILVCLPFVAVIGFFGGAVRGFHEGKNHHIQSRARRVARVGHSTQEDSDVPIPQAPSPENDPADATAGFVHRRGCPSRYQRRCSCHDLRHKSESRRQVQSGD